jgi:WD40 repeat protein
MSKKIVIFVFTAMLFCSLKLTAQQESTPTAQIKYKISDYKNQSVYKGRYALTRFNADDSMFAVIGDEDRIVVYETATGNVIQSIKYGNDNTNAFSFGADGKSVLFLDKLSFSVEVWDLETGERRHKIEGRSAVSGLKNALRKDQKDINEGLQMSEMPLSPDGKSVLVGKTDSRFDVVDLENGEARFSVEQTSETSEIKDLLKLALIPGIANSLYLLHISKAIYSSDGKRILLSNGDRNPTLWDAETGKMIAILGPQEAKVYKISFSPDGKLAATVDKKAVSQIWDATTGRKLSTLGKPGNSEMIGNWSPQGDFVATHSSKERGHIFNAQTGEFISETGKLQIRDMSFSSDGRLIATLAKKDKTKLGQIFNVADGKFIADLPRLSDEERPLDLEWSSDGKLLAISSIEYVKIFNNRGEFLQSLENAVYPARFSHNGKLLLTGGKNDDGFIWQISGK